MKKLSDKFKTAERLVAFCLRKFPGTRGNDKTLRLKVWDLQGFRLPKKLIPFFYKVLDAETISRVRRKIQGQGLYRADSLKTAQRSLRSMEHRSFLRKEEMKLPSKSFWHDFKLVGITIAIFAMFVNAYVSWTLNKVNQELRQENAILKHNIQEITKQYGQSSIKLELKK